MKYANAQRAARGLLATVAAIGLIGSSPAAFAQGTPEKYTDQVVIKFKAQERSAAKLDSRDFNSIQSAIQQKGFLARHLRTGAAGTHVIKLDRFASQSSLRTLLADVIKSRSDVEFIEPDLVAQPAQVTTNDPLLSSQWGLASTGGGVNAAAAWNYASGSGTVVAVVDTGVLPHADLAGNILSGYDFITDATGSNDGDGRDSNATDPGDWRTAGQCASNTGASNSSWHGTHVSGITAGIAGNGIGIVGVAPAAKILPVRVLGACGGYTSDIADGVAWAAGVAVSGVPTNTTPAKVINLSLGGVSSCPSVMQTAVTAARSAGAVVIAAAGNNTADVSTFYPANCSGVVSVVAVDSAGSRASFSNYGSGASIAAPGVSILSTYNSGTTSPGSDTYDYLSGTSMAAPHVAGVAALMFSANSTLTPNDVALVINGTARAFPGTCTGCGSGLLDAGNAVNVVRSGAAQGTFQLVTAARLSATSALIVVKNNGTGWITGVKASCTQSGSSISTPPPSALSPGQSVNIYATTPSLVACSFKVTGNGVTNSPLVFSSY